MNTKLFFIVLIIFTILLGRCINNQQNTSNDCEKMGGVCRTEGKEIHYRSGDLPCGSDNYKPDMFTNCSHPSDLCCLPKHTFIEKTKEKCSKDSDCALPSEYAIKSSCRYDVECVDFFCNVVCPDW